MSRKGIRKGLRKGTKKGTRKGIRKGKRLRKGKNKTLKKGRNIQKGGANVHYVISSHGSIDGVDTETDNNHPNRNLYTYVEYGEQLDIGCGFALQTWLSRHRRTPRPNCQQYDPYITKTMLNARVYVERYDTWNSGIVDVTDLTRRPTVVESWTYPASAYERGYTLQDALNTIDTHFRRNYNRNWEYNVHILTCLS